MATRYPPNWHSHHDGAVSLFSEADSSSAGFAGFRAEVATAPSPLSFNFAPIAAASPAHPQGALSYLNDAEGARHGGNLAALLVSLMSDEVWPDAHPAAPAWAKAITADLMPDVVECDARFGLRLLPSDVIPAVWLGLGLQPGASEWFLGLEGQGELMTGFQAATVIDSSWGLL